MSKPSKRAQQCKKISESRAERQKREHRRRRSMALFYSMLLLGAVGLAGVDYMTGAVRQGVTNMVNDGWQATADAGYKLRHIYLSGHEKVHRNEVMSVLDVEPGAPILQLSLSDIQQRLMALPEIKSAEINRSLPDTLHIRVIERRPVAIWQYQGQLTLLDDEGIALRGIDKAELGSYNHLPLLVGQGAHEELPQLFEILAYEPKLVRELKAASWVGGRRWDITFKSGMKVKLPQDHPEKAWKRFVEMVNEYALMERRIQVLDMRLPDRLFMEQVKQVVSEEGAHNT